MPVVLRKNIDGVCDVVLWRIDEPVVELEALCGGADTLYAKRFGTEKRRTEWLAWHAALRAAAPGSEVDYNVRGAPVLAGGGYISVSHADGFVAVMISASVPCGIDIEGEKRDFSRVVPRITTEAELALVAAAGYSGRDICAVLWCAKEALYKWAGEEGVGFREEIRITHAERGSGKIAGSVRGRAAVGQVFLESGLCIVCCRG